MAMLSEFEQFNLLVYRNTLVAKLCLHRKQANTFIDVELATNNRVRRSQSAYLGPPSFHDLLLNRLASTTLTSLLLGF